MAFGARRRSQLNAVMAMPTTHQAHQHGIGSPDLPESTAVHGSRRSLGVGVSCFSSSNFHRDEIRRAGARSEFVHNLDSPELRGAFHVSISQFWRLDWCFPFALVGVETVLQSSLTGHDSHIIEEMAAALLRSARGFRQPGRTSKLQFYGPWGAMLCHSRITCRSP